MRRLSVCATAAALLLCAGAAGAASIGIGGFGGLSIPIVQDDNGAGAQFGVRAPVSVLPLLTVEPYFAATSGGDKDATFGGVGYTRTGIDVTAFGANAILNFGSTLRFYPFAGIGSHKMSRDDEDVTKTGYTVGLGLGFSPPVANLSFDVRGDVTAVVDGDTSRKWANVTAGVTYKLFDLPMGP